jgi:probable rRNA maturation factor
MITIKNTQKKIVITHKDLKRELHHVLNIIGYPDYDLGLWVTTNITIRRYNNLYRNKDTPTDILSFPYHTTLQPGKPIRSLDEDDNNLGDLIISAEYVAQAALKKNISFKQHLRTLLVHGICHLLGYDHNNDKDYRRMRTKELSILKKLNLIDPLTQHLP